MDSLTTEVKEIKKQIEKVSVFDKDEKQGSAEKPLAFSGLLTVGEPTQLRLKQVYQGIEKPSNDLCVQKIFLCRLK